MNDISSPQLPKYSIVLRFLSTLQEIDIIDFVFCKSETGVYYYKFIDVEGRLWNNVPENDVIVIDNFPNKEHLDNFIDLKHKSIELEKQLKDGKPVNKINDVNIG